MNRAALTAETLPDFGDVDERAPTSPYLAPVFFGQRVPAHSAELPLPDQRVVGSSDVTVNERTGRSCR
jgi:hypothetical protein